MNKRINLINKVLPFAETHDQITTHDLKDLGINEYGISVLRKEGYLKNLKRGTYTLDTAKGMYCKARYLEEKDDELFATQIEEAIMMSYRLDESYPQVNFQMFSRAIKNRDYTKALGHYVKMIEVDDSDYKKDANFYLFLMSFLTVLPEGLRKRSLELVGNDISISGADERFINVNDSYLVRKEAFRQNFQKAITLLDQIKCLNQAEVVTEELLVQVLEVQFRRDNIIKENIEEGNYINLVQFLEGESRLHKLSLDEKFILTVARDLVEMIKTNKARVEFTRKKDLSSLIATHNYAKALDHQFTSKQEDTNLTLLLKSALKVSERIMGSSQSDEFSKNEKTNKPLLYTSTNDFTNMYVGLVNGEVDKALEFLSSYLSKKRKTVYFPLMEGLVELALLEEDIMFIDVVKTMDMIEKGKYLFNLKDYVNHLRNAISNNDLVKAEIYLNIIVYSHNKIPEVNTAPEILNVLKVLSKELKKRKAQKEKVIKPVGKE